jgi:hypothetical protein
MDGASVNTGENESIKFQFGNEEHNINIDFIGLDSVGITIQSDPIKFNLSINEVKEVDLNGDGIYDIRVKLVKIEDGKATIAVKKIEIVVCNGIWNCSSWGECSSGKQTRICKDLNNCGSLENRPFTEKNCVEIIFIENDSAFDENNSVNNLTDDTLEELSYNFNCSKDINSFVEASRTCSLFNITCNTTSDIFGMGVFQKTDTYYEIKGLENGNCTFYFKYNNLTILYSSEFKKNALASGTTLEEFNKQLEDANKEYKLLIEKNSTCYYPIVNLTNMILSWKNGELSGSSEDYITYNCTGSLYN